MNQDLTTLICLFHSRHHAGEALEKILKAGVPEPNVTTIGLDGSNISASKSSLEELNVPEKDRQHLLDAISAGGAVLFVAALSDHVEEVEAIFHEYATKIDEADVNDDMSDRALPTAAAPLAAAPLAAALPAVAAPSPAPVPARRGDVLVEDVLVAERDLATGEVHVLETVVAIPVEELMAEPALSSTSKWADFEEPVVTDWKSQVH